MALLTQLRIYAAAFEKRRPVAVRIALFLIISVAVFSGAYRKPITLTSNCPLPFLIAHNLTAHGTFSMKSAVAGARPASGRAMAPAYPSMLALLAQADADFAGGIDCRRYFETHRRPGDSFETLRLLQTAAGIGILVLVYYLALELTRSHLMGCATVVLYVIGGKLGEFARYIEPSNVRNLALFLGLYLLAVACRKKQSGLFVAAGASLGVAALFYPILAILLLALPLALAAVPWISRGEERGRWSKSCYLISIFLGGIIVVAPWAMRNFYLFGDPMLADYSEASLLSFRVAYNAMPYSDWPLAVLSWIPSYGDVLTNLFFGEGIAYRFDSSGPYYANMFSILDAATRETPSGGNLFLTVWTSHVLANPAGHLLTSIPIFTRGMWGTHGFMGIVGMCLLPRLLRHLFAGQSRSAAIAIATFAFLLVAVQSLLAPNFYWMSTPGLFLMALAIAQTLSSVTGWIDISGLRPEVAHRSRR